MPADGQRAPRLSAWRPAARRALLSVHGLRLWLRRRLGALARAARETVSVATAGWAVAELMSCAVAQRLGWFEAEAVSEAWLRGPVTQEVVRNMVTWQAATSKDAEAAGHGRLVIRDDARSVQLDRLLSLVCLSGRFRDFDIVLENPSSSTAAPHVDLGTPRPVTLEPTELGGLRRAFLPLLDARRTATQYLKVVHPRAVIVAVSLTEDDDGFVDDELGKWLPLLHRFRAEMPVVAFCLLNRTMLVHDDQLLPDGVSPVRSLGFGFVDAVALAQVADAFIGRLDVFGLAAMAAGRAGVYVDATKAGHVDAEHGACFVADASSERCLEMLRALMPRLRSSA